MFHVEALQIIIVISSKFRVIFLFSVLDHVIANPWL